MFNWIKKYKAEIIVVALALALRGIFFIAYLIKFGDAGLGYGDTRIYLDIADNLLKSGHFSILPAPDIIPDSYIAPGYPFFLAFFKIFTNALWPVGLVQVILGGVTALFVYRLGGLWGKRIGLISALLFALEPTMAFWTPLILTEALYTFLFVLALYLMALGLKRPSIKAYLFSAFVLGLAALVRPGAQYIFYLFAAFSFIYFLFISKNFKKTWTYLLIFIVIFNAVISPWLIRNYEAWGKAKLSSAGWYVLAKFNTGEYQKFWKYFPRDLPAVLPEKPAGTPEGDWNFNLEGAYRSYVEKIWSFNPPAAIAVHVAGLAPFFLGDGYMNILRTFWPELEQPNVLFGARDLAGLPSVPLVLTNIYAVVFWLGKIFWMIIYLFMLYGMFVSIKDKEMRLYNLLFLAIMMSIALPAGAIAYARYRFPVNPLIFLMFAYGLDSLLKNIGRKRLK
jgi:hypothetical protein